MAELQVGIKADVKDAKRVVRSLDEIKRAAGETGVSLQGAAQTAKAASVSYQVASGSALKLAGSTDLTSAANLALANTLRTTSAMATKSAASQTAAATASSAMAAGTERASLAARALSATQTKLIGIVNATTAAFGRMGAAAAAAYTGATAASTRFITQARTALGSVVGASTAAAGVGAAVAVAFGVGAKGAVELEDTLDKIVGLVGVARDEVEGFKKPLRDLSTVVGKDVNELADALFFVTSAGFRGQEALDVLEASAKAAAAGLGETKQVADAVTSAINAYGAENLNASRATDILVATVREGKAEADSIAGALGQVLPVASELGVNFEELGGTIAALTRIGLGADQGATALGATLSAIQKPGKDAVEALKEVGLNAEELRRKVREEGLLPVLQDLKNAFGDNEEAIARVFPNVRALRAVLPLVGVNAKQVTGIFKGVAESAGSTEAAFAAVSDGYKLKLKNALNDLKNTLQDMGETILPAITFAFEGLVTVVGALGDAFVFTRNATTAAAEGLAAIFVGSDDPVIRNLNNIRELNDELERLEGGGSTRKFFTEVGGIELTGTREEQIEKLKERLTLERKIEQQTGREVLQRQRANAALAAAGELVEDIKEKVDPPIVVIDKELQDKAKESLQELRDEVTFMRMEATNLQELGKEGIGLAEDFMLTSKLARDLQGNVKADAVEVRKLINEKRELQKVIDDVTEAIQKQEAATQFLKDLSKDTENLAEKFAAVKAGGSLVEVESLQQARDILADLGTDTTETVDSIQQMIIAQKAWNAAVEAMDPTGLNDVALYIRTLQAGLAGMEAGTTEFERQSAAIKALQDSALDMTFQELGIGELVDFTSLEQQLIDGEKRLREAFSIAGVIDPDQDPRFEAAMQRLRDKIFGIGDIAAEFGKTAAQNLQQNFSDFFFDPFDSSLKDMASNFSKTLLRLASDILANQVLLSALRSLSSFGGGIGAFAQAGISAIGGARAEGGPISAGQSYLVGEKGPEVITPRQSGSVIPNSMLGGNQEPPQVNVGGPTIVNTIEDSAIVAAFNRGGGGQVILNEMSEKRSAYRQALGINN